MQTKEKKTNRQKLEAMGEGCSYEKPCEQCEVKEECSKEIEENQ